MSPRRFRVATRLDDDGRVAPRISSPRLVGRGAELAALRAALDTARTGHGRVVVVVGDAGLGKTRLLDRFAGEVGDATVFTGGGIPLAGDAPYAPLIDVFRALSALHPPAAPVLLQAGQGPRPDPLGGTRLLAAAGAAVHAAAASGPLVVAVEDLHWVDAATRDVLAYLARAIRDDPVLLLTTARAEELAAGGPAALFVTELLRLPHAQRITLPPLPDPDIRALAGAIADPPLPPAVLDRLVRRAAGNPLFAEELLAADPTGDAVPDTVREVVLARFDRLPGDGRRVVRAAAVLGREVAEPVLAAVAPDDLDGLTAAVRHGFLTAAGGSYAFRHPLIQETVYADTPLPQRRRMHRAAARALDVPQPAAPVAELAGRAAQVAHHRRHAGEEPAAVRAALRAGELAMAAHAPADALTHYRYALSTDHIGVSEWEQAAEAASMAGDNELAKRLAARVVEAVDPAREPVRAALRLERLARFSWLGGDTAGARVAYERSLRAIPAVPSTARARILAAAAQNLMLQGRNAAALANGLEAIEVAAAADAPAERAHATDTVGTSLAKLGRHAAGVALLREAIGLASALGDEAEVARCYVNLTEAYGDARRIGDAERAGEEGLTRVAASGLARPFAGPILGNLLHGLYLACRWDELLRRFDLGMADDPPAWSSVPMLAVRARVALARGDLDTAAGTVATMAAVPGVPADPQFGPLTAVLTAELAAARGAYRQARAALDRAAQMLDGKDDQPPRQALTVVAVRVEADALEAAGRAGRRTDAGAAAERADRHLAAATSALSRAVAAGGEHNAPFALALAVASAERTRIGPEPPDPAVWQRVADDPLADPYLTARSRFREAESWLARRARRRASVALAAAGEIADALGAAPLAAEVAGLGRRARLAPPERPPARATDPLGLTPREREVIALLHAGLSNAQIARTLFISEKTASVHVSNILRKLGVTSRLQAARHAHRPD
jgi:DNA-binding CsgD family transcriptional regulator/tetratricopeptide (TPR) repeat protein